LAEKCILGRFLGPPKKSTLQPARHKAFTKDAKTRHLYDTHVFSTAISFDHFLRNLLKINKIALKKGQPDPRQNRVTYNNMPFAKPEKWGLLGEVSFFKIRGCNLFKLVAFRPQFIQEERSAKGGVAAGHGPNPRGVLGDE
jgi:hypothetical protein